jgi:hypothetical protein
MCYFIVINVYFSVSLRPAAWRWVGNFRRNFTLGRQPDWRENRLLAADVFNHLVVSICWNVKFKNSNKLSSIVVSHDESVVSSNNKLLKNTSKYFLGLIILLKRTLNTIFSFRSNISSIEKSTL